MKSWSVRLFVLLVLSIIVLSLNAAAQDTSVSGLLHDSRDDLYRYPVGAVPFGTEVTLRLRALEGEVDAVSVRLYSTFSQTQQVIPLFKAAVTPDGYEYWETSVISSTDTTVMYYRFILRKGSRVWYYEDDTIDAGGQYVLANKGGTGTALDVSSDASYQIAVYDPTYYTPEWMRNAVIYQIFPDRFRNGDTSNDPVPGQETFYGELDLLVNTPWNSAPVDGRTRQAPSGIGYFNADFHGGDLAGITEKLDYLQDLGVTAIYLNPIFEARSNHRYDTADYKAIDPILGTMDDFRTLVGEMRARGMHLILDGVFNHMSSDSPVFDRYDRFPGDLGACESAESEYRNWFYFMPPEGNIPDICADDGAGNTFYESWFGFDSIPKINNTIFATRAYFFRGQESVARTWGVEGIGGWRLDVGGDIDNGRDPKNTYWEGFRTVVRLVNPEAVIVGEEWNDATEWLLGDEWDSVMNYRFRRAIIGFVRGSDFADNDGRIPGLTPAQFLATVQSVEEDYPPMAYRAMMNLLGSHDTARLFYALDNDVDSLKLAASVLFTLPGAPTVYYGDEIALDAPNVASQDDPYNRAPYPWPDEEGDHYPAPNEDVLAHYQALGQLRAANPALREGAMIPLSADDSMLAFLRLSSVDGSAALVVVNTGADEQPFALGADFAAGILPSGMILDGALGTDGQITVGGAGEIAVPAQSVAVMAGSIDPSAFTAMQPTEQHVSTFTVPGAVTISWKQLGDATLYYVYRSPVSRGGFERITAEPVAALNYVDDTVTNGFAYYYAVAPASDAGVAGQLVGSAKAIPAYTIDAVRFVGDMLDLNLEAVLQVGLAVDVDAAIEITGVTGSGEADPGIRAEVALQSEDGNFTWQRMTYAGVDSSADLYTAQVRPTYAATYSIGARFSTDAGENWTYATIEGTLLPQLTVLPNEDTVAPDAPALVTVVGAGLSGVSLAWEPVAADDLALYRVYRTTGGETSIIAEVPPSVTTFDDVTVSMDNQYRYAIAAVDQGLNESDQVATHTIDIAQATFDVRFVVNAPENTPDNAVVHIAGDFKSGDQFPTWDPGADEMILENLGNDQFAITLPLAEGINIDYKFVRGTWDAVEKGPACEEIDNRKLTVGLDSLGAPNDEGVYVVEHIVAKWRDLDRCG